MPKVGAHVSAAGSLSLSFEHALKLGAECTQIFITPPQQWLQIPHTPEVIESYKQRAKETNISPNFIHAIYLISLATSNPEHLQKSIDWLIYSQNEAKKLGISGTIFHIGSYKESTREEALNQVIQEITTILNQTEDVNLILENSAGAGNLIGDSLAELGIITKAVKDTRLKVCLDTQHAFASGYDLRTKARAEEWAEEIDKEIGMEKLVAIHANDSKTELGSKRDRHENIGQGFIGLEGFKSLINHPKLKNIPFILEIPGEAGKGPDKNNVQILKDLRDKGQVLRITGKTFQ